MHADPLFLCIWKAFLLKLQILKEKGQGASPRDIGDKIIKNLPQTDYFEKVNCHLILVKFYTQIISKYFYFFHLTLYTLQMLYFRCYL